MWAYLTHQEQFADPAVRRKSAQHILDCTHCSKRLTEARASREAPHLDEGALRAYLTYQAVFEDPNFRKETGDHILECAVCSERLTEVRKVLRQTGELEQQDPELLTSEIKDRPAVVRGQPPPHR